MKQSHRLPIGVFDSGYGGLTILNHIRTVLPEYDFVYLGDNARSPYGGHTFDTIYKYTQEAVGLLFQIGCPLVILACNTASARALRTLQQKDLARSSDPTRRILGVIRPTVERMGKITHNNHVGLLATEATVNSHTYVIETEHYYPDVHLSQHPAPIWVPLVENGEVDASEGVLYFVHREIDRLMAMDPEIDTILLGCTHYPLLLPRIREYVPGHISVVDQGTVVAESLRNYLERHPDMDARLTKGGSIRYLTTENDEKFATMARRFLKEGDDEIPVEHVNLVGGTIS